MWEVRKSKFPELALNFSCIWNSLILNGYRFHCRVVHFSQETHAYKILQALLRTDPVPTAKLMSEAKTFNNQYSHVAYYFSLCHTTEYFNSQLSLVQYNFSFSKYCWRFWVGLWTLLICKYCMSFLQFS